MRTFGTSGKAATIGQRLLACVGAAVLGAITLLPATRASAKPFVVQPQLRQASDSGAAAKPAEKAPTQDTIIFKNQRVLTGTIVSETADVIVFKGKVNGIDLNTEYKKSEILEIKRGVKVNVPTAAPSKNATPTEPVKAEEPTIGADPSKKRVYFVDLVGVFGEEISEQPLRSIIKDAVKSKADVIVFKMNNDWKRRDGLGSKLPNDAARFDLLFRAEKMMPIFRDEVPLLENPPRIVFWVDQAMGGAAFMPLMAKDIFFTSQGRMGGVGDLGEIFEGTGDEVVRQKQRSLRLGHAKGVANLGGYDPRIVEAMCIKDFVLSVSFEEGKPKFYERMPENPGEVLLTDDGKGINVDDLRSRAANEGNDVLTLNAKIARDIGLSKGTADTKEELLFQLGLDRVADVIPDSQGQRIMKGFADTLYNQQRRIINNFRKWGEIQVQGSYDERTAARNKQLQIVRDMISIFKQYGEALSQLWLFENEVPEQEFWEGLESQIKRQQLADKK
ncbi:MAG: hypothetical protein SFY96_02510 [Planctomycetota bacterium]|nr:hypothetical protein [Planctomycetota bacterium]